MNDIILNEQTIASSNTYNLCIGIYPRETHISGFLKDPYFKIFNHYSETSADSVARISILRPEYINHSNGNKKRFVLNKKDIAFMLKIMKDPSHGYDTTWQYMISYLLNLSKNYDIEIPYNIYQPMPDYTLLRK